MKRLFLVAALLMFSATATSEPFAYRWVGSVQWVPYAAANEVLDLSTVFGRTPDLITTYCSSDFRMRPITGRFGTDVGFTGTNGSAVLDTSLTTAEIDTVITAALGSDGFGAIPVPAAGKTFYGKFYFLIAPAAPDTIVVDAYVLWR